jgi:hypothetical protein
MVLKNVCLAGACTMLLAWSGMSMADEYRPDQFLGLDLSKAVLSPKPLGPPAAFAPVPVEAKSDRGSEGQQAEAEHIRHPRVHVAGSRMASSQPRLHAKPKARLAQVSAKLRPAPHTHAGPHIRLARQHRNPLDAQALDTRIQVWPCRSGGICNWKR